MGTRVGELAETGDVPCGHATAGPSRSLWRLGSFTAPLPLPRPPGTRTCREADSGSSAARQEPAAIERSTHAMQANVKGSTMPVLEMVLEPGRGARLHAR